MKKELLTSSYDYELPAHLIAQNPVQPRDHAKLLVYDRKTNTTTHTIFKNLLDFLPDECEKIPNHNRREGTAGLPHRHTSSYLNLV
ncbi:MAG TPA: hypothetical protein EYP02_07400 [Sulfurovum sp.]|nr:hypothetical protein [Sulfurovum sp.]